MKVSELIELLREQDLEKEVIVFSEGNLYPTLAVNNVDGVIEIGCGWSKIEDED